MPGATNIDVIESALEETLSFHKKKNRELDQNVASSRQRFLQQNIEFLPSKRPYSNKFSHVSGWKSKTVLMDASKKNKETPSKISSQTSSSGLEHTFQRTDSMTMQNGPGPSGDARMGESLPTPRVVIYPPEKLQLKWRQMHKVGGGLANMGNTCFLNATLQCLTYTPALVNYCLSDEHAKTCKQPRFCLMCTMRQHIKTSLQNSGSSFKPNAVLHKLKYIAKHFRYGRQQDAHEFLRLLMDGMQKACLDGHKKLDKLSKETTVIHQIFGGFFRSQVQCLKCSARSNTYEPFLDLTLNLKGVNTVEAALAKFVRPETLDSANAYDCERCGKKRPAKKRFSIHKIPNVLTIQLCRFGYSQAAGKINKHVQFPEKLNLRPYMSQRQGDAENYHLYAVLVHSGHHCNMGHYFCYIRAPSNVWYIMNDSAVHSVPASRVLGSQAYLLFYTKTERSVSQAAPKAPLMASAQTPNGLVTPKLNGAFSRQVSIDSLSRNKAGGDVGIPVSREMVSPTKVMSSPFASGSGGVSPLKGKPVLPDTPKLPSSPQKPVQNHKFPKDFFKRKPEQKDHDKHHTEKTLTPKADGLTSHTAEDKPTLKKESSSMPTLMRENSFVSALKKEKSNESALKKERSNESTLKKEKSNESALKKEKSSESPLKKKNSNESPLKKEKSSESALKKEKSNESALKKEKSNESALKKEKSNTPALKREGSSSVKESDVTDVNHTPKLKKQHSSFGVQLPPILQKENTVPINRAPSPEGEKLRLKLKKIKTAFAKKVSVSVPSLARVNSSPAAHNMWRVHAMDSTPSPSVDSCHSQHSTPSTHGCWTIIGTGKKRSLLERSESLDHVKKRKLSFSPEKVKSDQSVVNNVAHDDTAERTKTGKNSLNGHTQQSQMHNHISDSVTPPNFSTQDFKTPSAQSSRTSFIEKTAVCENGDSGQFDVSPVTDSTSVNKQHKKHKKKKKKSRKKASEENSELENDAESKNGSFESSQPYSKEKETKHKVKENGFNWDHAHTHSEDSNSVGKKKEHGEDSNSHSKKIKHRDSDMSDDKHTSSMKDSNSENKKKTHSEEPSSNGKKKKHRDFDASYGEGTSAGKGSNSHCKKKKQRDLGTSDDENTSPKKDSNSDGKKKIHSQDSNSPHKKKRHRDQSMSEDEHASAGKSAKLIGDNILPSEETPQDKTEQKSSGKQVPVQAWDHYVKDSLGLKKKEQGQGEGVFQKPALMWDGSRKSEVVEQLCKRPSVTTWNGEKSEAEIEAEREEKRRKKKTWKDHYEEEIDRGKVKKVKKKIDDTPWAFNPFQKFQNHRNQEKFRWDEDFGSTNKTHSFAANPVSSLNRSHSDMHAFDLPQISSNGSSQHSHSSSHNFKKGQHPLLSRSYSYVL